MVEIHTYVIINCNAQSFNGLDLVWIPHNILIAQEVSEGRYPVLLWRVDSGVQCHRQRVRRHHLPGLGGSRVPRVQAGQLLRTLLNVGEYSLDW